MPYTRAYQLPVQEIAAEEVPNDLNEVGQIPKTRPSLNITPSSNWIQETFNARSLVEDAERGNVFIIEKAKQSSLYQRVISLLTRSTICRITVIASDPVPSRETIARFAESLEEEDSAQLDLLIQTWKADIIEAYREISIAELIEEAEDTIYLRGDSILRGGELESVRLTISSPDMPTRGDTPVTAIYYSPVGGYKIPVADGGVRGDIGNQIGTIAEGPIPFTWTDKSGFRSTMLILPHVIYEIQPVSIELGYEITLLA